MCDAESHPKLIQTFAPWIQWIPRLRTWRSFTRLRDLWQIARALSLFQWSQGEISEGWGVLEEVTLLGCSPEWIGKSGSFVKNRSSNFVLGQTFKILAVPCHPKNWMFQEMMRYKLLVSYIPLIITKSLNYISYHTCISSFTSPGGCMHILWISIYIYIWVTIKTPAEEFYTNVWMEYVVVNL